tara:strand:+ start:392 stop:742 length:351 start_codon:yes stop_codon:yes gene_type:complete
MIDTDKYEGHTRGPWRYYDDEDHDCWVFEGEDIEAQARVAFFAFTPCEGIAYLDDPDLNLMIDAPLLLAEVMRLREQARKLVEVAERVRSDISDQDTGSYYQLGNQIEKMNRLVRE